ncbi:PLP-dependent lyase/thiolase [Patescibacteria group bacterium]|nr:PLP-dependent lyase/thiolase [Patescibacteria group bacterium]
MMNETPQKSYPMLAKKIGLPGLWIKHEYLNESGSHKIRLMEKMIKKYLKKGQKKFVISSSGNVAIAAAYYLNKYIRAKTELTIFVCKNIPAEKWQCLKKAVNNSKTIKVKKVVRPKQQAFLFAKKYKAVFLRGSIESIAPQAYYSLAKELAQIPRLKAVFIPTSSGITALGLHQGFKKLKKKIEIHLVQTEKIHPLAREFDYNFSPAKKSLARAIVDRVGLRKKDVLKAVRESLGSGWIISDQALKKAKKLLQTEANLSIKSFDSLLSLAGVIKAQRKGWPLSGSVCCLFTGL